jgi:hypothetical protein
LPYDELECHIKTVDSVAVPTVVVGNATVLPTNEAPHVIAIAAVPVICITRISPSTGVPVRLVVKEVISAV